DAGMPVTQLLPSREGYRRISSSLSLDAEVLTAAAPPRPRFETSRELEHQHVAGNGAPHPRIVVPIAGHAAIGQPQFAGPVQQSSRTAIAVAGNGMAEDRAVTPPVPGKTARRGRSFVVGLVLVLCFAGLLLATGAYVRSLIRQRAAQQATVTNTANSF